jgi:amino acid transporter
MVSVVCLLLLFCTINQVTSSSRQLWSFARDGGLPFAAWLGHVCYTSPLAILIAANSSRYRKARTSPSTRCCLHYSLRHY